MVTVRDLRLADGRVLRSYDSGIDAGDAGLTVVWFHGSPQTGALLDPLLAAAGLRGIRLVSYGRPSYGGSSPRPGRDVASAAADLAQVVDAFGIDRFAVMGASGGGPHALACAALLPDRVLGAVTVASPAPYSTTYDWYAGMTSAGGLRAAAAGRDARARFEETAEFDPESFTEADMAALDGGWTSLGADVGRSAAFGPDGPIDDDVAFATPWGFGVDQITARVLLVQGGADRVIPPSHATALLLACPRAELWLRPHDGHISVLDACPVALDWLLALPSR